MPSVRVALPHVPPGVTPALIWEGYPAYGKWAMVWGRGVGICQAGMVNDMAGSEV